MVFGDRIEWRDPLSRTLKGSLPVGADTLIDIWCGVRGRRRQISPHALRRVPQLACVHSAESLRPDRRSRARAVRVPRLDGHGAVVRGDRSDHPPAPRPPCAPALHDHGRRRVQSGAAVSRPHVLEGIWLRRRIRGHRARCCLLSTLVVGLARAHETAAVRRTLRCIDSPCARSSALRDHCDRERALTSWALLATANAPYTRTLRYAPLCSAPVHFTIFHAHGVVY